MALLVLLDGVLTESKELFPSLELFDVLFGSRIVLACHLILSLSRLLCLSLSLSLNDRRLSRRYNSRLCRLLSIISFLVKELGEVLVDHLGLGRVLSGELLCLSLSLVCRATLLILILGCLSESEELCRSLKVLDVLLGSRVVLTCHLSLSIRRLLSALLCLSRLVCRLSRRYNSSLCRLVSIVSLSVEELSVILVNDLRCGLGNDSVLSRLFGTLLCLLSFDFFLICKYKRVFLFACAENLLLVGLVLILILSVVLLGVLGSLSELLESLSLLVSRNSRLELLLPVRIVALGVVYVGIDNVVGSSRGLDGLSLLSYLGLVTVVEGDESRGNSRLIVLSLYCLIVSGSGELLFSLRSSGARLGGVGDISIHVTVNDLFELICCVASHSALSGDLSRPLLTVEECECLALCLSVSLSAALGIVDLYVRVVAVIGHLGSLIILEAVSLNICIGGSNYANSTSVAITVLGYE